MFYHDILKPADKDITMPSYLNGHHILNIKKFSEG